MYEFQVLQKTDPPIITGPVAQMLSERMDADKAEIAQTHSYGFYRRVTLGTLATATVIFQIPDDYYYWLSAFDVFYPLTAGGDESPSPEMQVSQVERNRVFSAIDIPVRLTSSPAQQQAIRYRVDVNHVFFPSGKIQLRITPTNATNPTNIDILSEGLRIPKDFTTQE